MKYIRAILRFIIFLLFTFGIYSIWFFRIFVPDANRKLKLRQWIFKNWANGFARIAGMKIQVRGTVPQSPFLLVSNHLGYMDIPLIRSKISCVYVAKGEMKNWFLAGSMVGNMGNIFVNRQNKRDIPRAGKELLDAIDRGENVVIFPEGTSSKGETILPLKSSFLEFAASQKLPVNYVSLHYKTPDGFPVASESVCWWRLEDTLLDHMFKLFQLPSFEATIKFGETPFFSEDRKELADQLWNAMKADFEPIS